MVFERVELYSTHSSQATGRYYDFQILFCETPVEGLSTSFDANYGWGMPTEALSLDTLTITWADSSPGWNGFDLETPFAVNGTENLIVEFRYMGSTGTTVNARAASISPADRCLDGAYPTDPTGDLMSFLTSLRIHYSSTGLPGGPAIPGPEGLLVTVRSPFTELLRLELSAPAGAEAVLAAYTADGRLAGSLWRGIPGPEGTSLEIDAGRFPAGLILLVLEADGGRSFARCVRIP